MKIFVAFFLALSTLASVETCPIPKPFTADSASQQTQKRLTKWTTLDTNTDKPTLINFWASWCAPCRKEIPYLATLQKENTANIVLINIEDERKDADSVLASLSKNTMSTHYENLEALDSFEIQGLPASIVFYKGQTYKGIGILKDETKITQWLSCLAAQ